MIVLKFGGTSVGSVKAIEQVAHILKNKKSALVVCSAISTVTNSLQELAQKACIGEDVSKPLLDLQQLHLTIIEQLITATHRNPSIINCKVCFNQIEALLQSVATIKELSDKTLANILAYGELLSCFIVAEYLRSLDIPAQFTDARELIITKGSAYNNAPINIEATTKKLEQWRKNKLSGTPIITGFIASNEKGDTTNLGRGGSDYTASLLAGILEAEAIEIWTDVDGFYTADPRHVRKAFPLTSMSYQEALELSYFGAKVIYAPTLIPAINKQIPIWIKNTFNPAAHGTLIHQKDDSQEAYVKGVSSIEHITLINIIGNGMVGFKGFSARLFQALSNSEVNVILITQASSEHTITIAVAPSDAEKAKQAIQEEFEYELHLKLIEKPVLENNMSILAVVGSHMKNAKGVSGKLFTALGRTGVNISAIAQGSSELNISVVIKHADLHKSLNAVHDAMFISQYKTIHLYVVGIGSVGKELLAQLHASHERLVKEHKIYIQLVGIANSTRMYFDEVNGIPMNEWKEVLDSKGIASDMRQFVNTIRSHDLYNSVFVDNTANKDIANLYEQVFESNAAIVTCNKIACSSSLEQYKTLKKISSEKSLPFLYETNVGAGLPIIKTLQDLIVSGDEILNVDAVLSGTISYIFNNYTGQKSFGSIVREAQQLGYTEPDPRDDLNGLDFMRKVLILAREMSLDISMNDVNIEPILPKVCFEANSVEEFYNLIPQHDGKLEQLKKEAEQQGGVLRYIANISPSGVGIKLQVVDSAHPFYSLHGSDNIISFTTNRYKNNPLVVKGPGAGLAVTAAGVFADIIKTAKS